MNQAEIDEVWSALDRTGLAEFAASKYPPVFATISGAHLYGFASPDSDIDLRGAYLLPARDFLGLSDPEETLTLMGDGPIELDWVAHDLKKFVRMLTRHNGYAFEQLYSPLVAFGGPLHDELKALAGDCLTRGCYRHFQGFARSRRVRLSQPEPTVKHLLYAYRAYLSGLHLLREGSIQSNILALAEVFPGTPVVELVARKRAGSEHMAIDDQELRTHNTGLDRLEAELANAYASSHLPDEVRNRPALEDFLLRARPGLLGSAL